MISTVSKIPDVIQPAASLTTRSLKENKFLTNQIRHVTHSNSVQYQTVFRNRNFDFLQAMGGPNFELWRYPGLVSRALETESVAIRRGKQPLIHSTPGTLRPAIALTTQLSGSVQRVTTPYFHQLRTPDSELTDRSNHQNYHKIKKLFNEGANDYHPQLRKLLLSTNYGLLTNPLKGESAAYYVSRNWMSNKDPRKAIEIATLMIHNSLKLRGFSDADISAICLEYQPILEEYMKLPIGDLYILAIPNEILPTVAYDSRAFGLPTNKNPQQVPQSVNTCERLTTDGGHQARVIMDRRALSGNKDIDIIHVNDTAQVKKYTENFSMVPADQVEILSPYNLGRTTQEEQDYQKQKIALDMKCKVLEQQILDRAKEIENQ